MSSRLSLPALSTLVRASAAGAIVLALGACGAGGGPSQNAEDLGVQGSAITPIPGCDYSFARPSPSSLVSMGYAFVARYLSGDPSSGKDITASEASSLTGAGLDVVLVWETTGTDATSGESQGVSDAQAAAAEATAVGAPATRPIYFAIDFDAESGDASAINAYFQGVASVLGVSRTGVYGGYYIVNELFDAGLVTWGWQTYAWSGGSWDSRAQLRQTLDGVDGDELDNDEGMVADFGQWGPNAPSGAADYAAAFVSQSFPLASTALAMTEGQTIPSYIELKNVGTKTWDSNTHLGTTQPRDRASAFADTTWLSPNRPAGVTGTVAPGATYKFEFDLHAPAKAGTYDEYFGVVEDGVAWFSDPGQGGPPDNDLEVQVVVTARDGGAGVDKDAGGEASGSSGSGSRDAGEGKSSGDGGGKERRDAGTKEHADAGSRGGGVIDSGPRGQRPAGDGGSSEEGGTSAPGSSGGCSVGAANAPASPMPLLGLSLLVRWVTRRRRRRAR
jgi:hypothetical protein